MNWLYALNIKYNTGITFKGKDVYGNFMLLSNWDKTIKNDKWNGSHSRKNI